MPSKRYQVFVSSTYQDLVEEREAVLRALHTQGYIVAGMEFFGASGQLPWDVIRRQLDESDYFVVILAGRYGTPNKATGKGFVESEFDYATSKGLKPLAFLHAHPVKLPQERCENSPKRRALLAAFKTKVMEAGTTTTWTTAGDLAAGIGAALHKAEIDDPRAGWTRADALSTAGTTDPAPTKPAAPALLPPKEVKRLTAEAKKLVAADGALRETHPIGITIREDYPKATSYEEAFWSYRGGPRDTASTIEHPLDNLFLRACEYIQRSGSAEGFRESLEREMSHAMAEATRKRKGVRPPDKIVVEYQRDSFDRALHALCIIGVLEQTRGGATPDCKITALGALALLFVAKAKGVDVGDETPLRPFLDS